MKEIQQLDLLRQNSVLLLLRLYLLQHDTQFLYSMLGTNKTPKNKRLFQNGKACAGPALVEIPVRFWGKNRTRTLIDNIFP
jgi:hypothetical protein